MPEELDYNNGPEAYEESVFRAAILHGGHFSTYRHVGRVRKFFDHFPSALQDVINEQQAVLYAVAPSGRYINLSRTAWNRYAQIWLDALKRGELPMTNQRMAEKLKNEECVDVSTCPMWMERYYDVTDVFKGQDAEVDYADAKQERWIWSIGKHKVTGRIYASLDTVFYQNPDFDCVWLR